MFFFAKVGGPVPSLTMTITLLKRQPHAFELTGRLQCCTFYQALGVLAALLFYRRDCRTTQRYTCSKVEAALVEVMKILEIFLYSGILREEKLISKEETQEIQQRERLLPARLNAHE